MTNEIVLFG